MKLIAMIPGFLMLTPMMALAFDYMFMGLNPKFCRLFGWHHDKFVRDGKCARCGKHVLQDSNGDWF